MLYRRGVATVHYLMFSDHLMVRRAATETLCNVAGNETLLKVLYCYERVSVHMFHGEVDT